MDELTKNEKMRLTSLDRAIQSNCGTDYNSDAFAIVNPDKILEAAKKFEAYIKDEK